MTTRSDIERNPLLSPLAKLVTEFLSRQPARVFLASDIGKALGTAGHDIATEAYAMRVSGVCKRMDGDVPLPLGSLLLSDEVRAAYGARDDAAIREPVITSKKTKAVK